MYQMRLVDGLVEQCMADFPAMLITGPRATRKTTTAARHARSVVRLDRKADAEAYVILHTGPHMYELTDRITAAPIATLWS